MAKEADKNFLQVEESNPQTLIPKPIDSDQLAAQRQETLIQIRQSLRAGQQQMADWRGGPLAVSAVPGAGKSTGMAAAAAIAIAHYQLRARRQLIVVTFTRSAAANIKTKIRNYLQELSLPQSGFFVNTLHGMALHIASRYPDLSGFNWQNITLVSPHQGHRLIRNCVEQWIAANPQRYQVLLEGRQFDGEETERLRRQSVLRTEVLPNLAYLVIHEAKSSGYSPTDLWELSQNTRDNYEILAIASGLYQNYEKILRSRDLIDYDDMILGALRVLENKYARSQWQNQVFAVFEDEAQDSTPLQAKLLEILATDAHDPDLPPNLIRVGDPNQAINSTFTPADPIYFRDFCDQCDQIGLLATIDRAGRSTQIIIDAANFVLEWVNRTYIRAENHHAESSTPFRSQTIYPVAPGDPQIDANPAPEGMGLEIYTPNNIYQTVELIGERIINLFTKNPTGKAAILVRENKQGRFIAEVLTNPNYYHINVNLEEYKIPIYDVSDRERRSQVPGEILALLQFIDRPHSPDLVKAALTVLVNRQLIPTQDLNTLSIQPEEFLYPGPLEAQQTEAMSKARRFCCSLLDAHLELPIYDLISFLALTLKYDRDELATADKLSERIYLQAAIDFSMTNILAILSEIVNSERFEPVDSEENSESLYTKPHQLTIITMHKAKGLDWDYVFLPFLHEQTIPGNLRVPPQTQFLGNFTLAEVARAQIRASLHQQPIPDLASAWEEAGYLKTAEEFRLLYVAMTRAKRLLWLSAEQQAPFTWNKPENTQPQTPSPIIPALKARFPASVIEPKN